VLAAALLAAALAAAPGVAPPLALPAPDGRTVTLAGLRGTPVLVVFYRGHW